MNKIEAVVTKIDNYESLNIVSFDYQGVCIKMMSLELNNVDVGSKVILIVKPTHVIIGKDCEGCLSVSNELNAKVVDMHKGELLMNIRLRFLDVIIESLITKESFRQMNLKLHEDVKLYIKSSDISIMKVLS